MLLFLLPVYTFKLTEAEFIKQSFLISKNKLWKWKLVFPTVKRARDGTKRCWYSVQNLFIKKNELKSSAQRLDARVMLV